MESVRAANDEVAAAVGAEFLATVTAQYDPRPYHQEGVPEAIGVGPLQLVRRWLGCTPGQHGRAYE